MTVTPSYPILVNAGSFTSYTFNLPDTWGDGVRIIGQPGSTGYFTSINQLGVYSCGRRIHHSLSIYAPRVDDEIK